MVHHDEDVLSAADGHRIRIQRWSPDGEPAAVVQIMHGLGEHAARYARFAEAAAARGFSVVAHDHRGHGAHADEPGRFAAVDGWNKVVADAHRVNDAIVTAAPDTPVVMVGHSMGSYVAQAFAMHYGGRLAGLLLSGSNRHSRFTLLAGAIVARAEAFRLGGSGHSPLLHRLSFGRYNRPFAPARTDFDWLSRDKAEVDRYLADPLCGGPFTCSLWLELLRGLLRLSTRESAGRVPGDLPILITGGGDDPLGGDKGMGRLALRYAETLHNRLSVKVYPGGRHEMLNDVDRDRVTADWLDWIAATTGNAR